MFLVKMPTACRHYDLLDRSHG